MTFPAKAYIIEKNASERTMNIVSILKKNPIIHAVSTADDFLKAANGKSDVIFLLKSEVSALKKFVAYAHDRGKKIFIHIDLADGWAKQRSGCRVSSLILLSRTALFPPNIRWSERQKSWDLARCIAFSHRQPGCKDGNEHG